MQTMLHDSEQRSKDIMGVTRQITRSLRQLNMLSINAGIEAARSGDAGRGFAVVANEIKLLAMQNSKWADSISDALNDTEGQ